MEIGTGSVTRIIPANLQVALIGDSRADLGRNISGSSRNLNARGVLDWARFLTRQRFDHEYTDIYATSGQTTQYIIDNHLQPAIASGAGTIVCYVGLNDRRVSGGVAASITITGLTTIRDAVVSAGRIMVFVADNPVGNAANTADRLTSPQLQYHCQVHDWLLGQNSPGKGIYVVDPWPTLADQTVTTGDNITAKFTDGLHPNQFGSYYGFGRSLASLFTDLFPARNIIPATLADAYDATNNLRGVLTANVTTAGTGGTVTAPGAGAMTGVVADSYTATLANGTGLTVTLSKTADADGKIWQQIVASGTPTTAGALLSIGPASAAGSVGGDMIEVFCEMGIDAGQTGVNAIVLAGFAGTEGINFFDLDRGAATDIYPTDAMQGIMRARYVRTGTGSAQATFRVYFLQNVAVSTTIRFRALGIRKSF